MPTIIKVRGSAVHKTQLKRFIPYIKATMAGLVESHKLKLPDQLTLKPLIPVKCKKTGIALAGLVGYPGEKEGYYMALNMQMCSMVDKWSIYIVAHEMAHLAQAWHEDVWSHNGTFEQFNERTEELIWSQFC